MSRPRHETRERPDPVPAFVPPAPLIKAVRLHISGPDVCVEFELRRAPAGRGSYLAGLRAGDAGRSAIRHLTVSLRDGRVSGLSTYDFGTGTRTLHPRDGASCSGAALTARFPRASLAGLGTDTRISAFSSLNGHELQTGFPVAPFTVGGVA